MTLLPRKSPRKPMKRKSWMKKSSKPMPKKNPKRIAKRKVGYRKVLQGPEYKAARKEAMERAGGRCELWLSWTDYAYENRVPPIPFSYTGTVNAAVTHVQRCPTTEGLHAHHKSYPKGRKLRASDLVICCEPHHEYLESQKLHKTRMF